MQLEGWREKGGEGEDGQAGRFGGADGDQGFADGEGSGGSGGRHMGDVRIGQGVVDGYWWI